MSVYWPNLLFDFCTLVEVSVSAPQEDKNTDSEYGTIKRVMFYFHDGLYSLSGSLTFSGHDPRNNHILTGEPPP